MKKKLFFIVSIIWISFFSFSIYAENFNMEMEIFIPTPEEEEEEEPRSTSNDTFYSPSNQESRQFSWQFSFYPEAPFTFHYNHIPQQENVFFSEEGFFSLQTSNRPGTYHFRSMDPEKQNSEIYLDISQRSSASFEYFFAPTLHVKKSDKELSVYGWASPKQSLFVILEKDGEKKFTPILSSSSGYYEVILDLTNMTQGDYVVSTLYEHLGNTGEEKNIFFSINQEKEITTEEEPREEGLQCPKIIADLNGDCRVNYMDLEYLRSKIMIGDLNKDGLIDLSDYSIFSYFWTS